MSAAYPAHPPRFGRLRPGWIACPGESLIDPMLYNVPVFRAPEGALGVGESPIRWCDSGKAVNFPDFLGIVRP
ncbi:protein of unknown function [Methanoculleus bourgensis]|uniref:Uncharacterized protein n=1 Tax=Methanoculleus bourgensis TaxID=83986 RepID=A0A0X3BHZ1_9EURY|nr:protein of unknown function [Methanoculleus bourgensis]